MDKTIIKSFQKVEYKIYGYTLPEVPSHNGYVKIGDTTRDAATRVFEQVGTAGLNPNILFEKLAQKSDGKWFRDKDLHKFLLLNGIEKKDFNQRADEWFYFNGNPEKAEELTERFIFNDYDEIHITDKQSDYVLRDEQQKAVEKTLEYINSHNDYEEKEFLWNAKPRFGKTLTTYDLIRKIKPTNVLIVTNRPAIANSWFDDFKKFIAWQENNMKFVSETDALRNKAMSRSQYLDYLNTTKNENPAQIVFISLQDLKGAKFAGGSYDKLDWVPGLEWDLLVIDEAHEGIDTKKTDRAFNQIKRNFTLHLSGTPFKALANNKFNEEQIFNWSYIDEQEAKESWDESLGSNPYETMPTLNMFTYQMSKMIEDEILSGKQIADDENVDYAFDLNEFFKVKENGNFEYESSVVQFLDNLCKGKFPFSTEEYRNELNHTFWLLPRVNSAKALEKLLKKHPIFKEYNIILAAGDGVSLPSNIEDEALNAKRNEKSFDRVRNAIKKHEKTITLSVGQLTTGVTIPEWTAVFMLNNIESPSLYFQAAFRAQNPYQVEKDGKLYRKENAYIFDFSPDRTLRLYDDFANNLSSGSSRTSDERERKIKKLLNFFPVIAEDEEGRMHEINPSEVLTIFIRITSREVVKRGFMSNLLFTNIAGIFSNNSPFKDILEKIKPEKNKRLVNQREIKVTDPLLNEDGEVDVPKDIVIGKSKDLFGDKIYISKKDIEGIAQSINEPKKEQNYSIKQLADNITDTISNSFDDISSEFNLNKGKINKVQRELHKSIEEAISDEHLTFKNHVNESFSHYQRNINEAQKLNDEKMIEDAKRTYEEDRDKIEQSFISEVNEKVESTLQDLVEVQMEKVEEKKKKTTEDDVRDHLRGFSRTIPAFLMAYGDENTTLSNFHENIDEVTFKELTSITLDEFKKLRDGFTFVDNDGIEKSVPGLFNEVVFNASIKEFLDTRHRLANYFDDELDEDIFDYIPPQQTNQIFTPKRVVKMMVDALEKENPNIFKDKTVKFADLYTKSGLYITEIVKKLDKGLEEVIPNRKDRIKWILENQVYACAPSNIIYNIVRNFIFGELENVSTENLIEVDTLKLAVDEMLNDSITELFGDDNLKFDVIIGNPPYQDEKIGDNKTYAPPIYHKFLEESYKLADKVEMVHPARFLFDAGSTPKAWNRKMLSDEHLKVVYYVDDSSEVFPNTDIKGGIAITYRDSEARLGPIGTFMKYPELNTILKKVQRSNFNSIDKIISSADSYQFTQILHDDYPNAKDRLSKGHAFDVRSNVFDSIGNVFKSEKPSNTNQYVGIIGRQNHARVEKWIKKDYIGEHPNLYKYSVLLPGSNGNGDFGETFATPVIKEPSIGHTQTFISIGNFDNRIQAENLLHYVKTKFARAMLGILKATQANSRPKWKWVPMQNFTNESDIDWSKNISEIDQQLYKKYNLNEKEVELIENKVKPME